jgi:hypothetical protein
MLPVTPSLSAPPVTSSGLVSAIGGKPQRDFLSVLGSIATEANLGMPKNLLALERKINVGAAVSTPELLSAQITIHKFNLKVEMLSKGVESLISTAKRVQQQS